ncbi:cytochrome bd-I oxidase subunit CydX [Rhodoplanes sp. TEM]|uniref:Cytochrome bd-I oxidase subunit CydX n=1 Tax=Rhodoplanes tepidamans TaxID=200616 RepID=A0ABT5JDA9_RHOTP|nr:MULTISPECIES: cytochrome bd-I oxidase subunit CydX [Rhodoplanes]MDC7787678.1 cytochrome bd-I oxidase subunit CydX [Rhodoplanes tepidamans]MDC7983052.1 cytochrome bd-I oxidase subunit CydX [Rhodoplanes sp. TEM]MDQ0356434.1 cyd operon protein YbgT [Rhodoplanes tepidamans]
MWYFAWVLGIGFAVLLSILNAMWHEAQEDRVTICGGQQGGGTIDAGQYA